MVTRLPRPVRLTAVDPFEALADQTRRGIVERLSTGEELTAGALARCFPAISRPAVSKHLGVLRAAGIVRVRTHGRRRLYALDVRGVAAIDAWVERYRAGWQGRFTVLGGAA